MSWKGYTAADRRAVVDQVLERIALCGPQSLGDLYQGLGRRVSEYRLRQALDQLEAAGRVTTATAKRDQFCYGNREVTTTAKLYAAAAVARRRAR